MREFIEGWLTEEDLPFEPVEDGRAHFHLSATYPPKSPFRVDLVQPRRKVPDLLVIGAGVTVADNHREAFMRLTPDDRRAFIWEFSFLLGKRPVEFELHHPEHVLERFSVTMPLYRDGLIKDVFMRSLREVHRSKLLGIWKIQEFADEPMGPGFREFRKDLGF
jgi:hypothetical protein